MDTFKFCVKTNVFFKIHLSIICFTKGKQYKTENIKIASERKTILWYNNNTIFRVKNYFKKLFFTLFENVFKILDFIFATRAKCTLSNFVKKKTST